MVGESSTGKVHNNPIKRLDWYWARNEVNDLVNCLFLCIVTGSINEKKNFPPTPKSMNLICWKQFASLEHTMNKWGTLSGWEQNGLPYPVPGLRYTRYLFVVLAACTILHRRSPVPLSTGDLYSPKERICAKNLNPLRYLNFIFIQSLKIIVFYGQEDFVILLQLDRRMENPILIFP